jgi:hypothetical protein
MVQIWQQALNLAPHQGKWIAGLLWVGEMQLSKAITALG